MLDFGCDDSGYCIAMELLSGQTLQSVFDAVASDAPPVVGHTRLIELDEESTLRAAVPALAVKAIPEPPHAAAGARAAPSQAPETAPVFGSVFVSTSGGAADVLVGGHRLGRTPTLLTLPVGHQRVTLVPNNGSASKDADVEIGSAGTVVLNVVFPPRAAPAPPSGESPLPAVDMPAPRAAALRLRQLRAFRARAARRRRVHG